MSITIHTIEICDDLDCEECALGNSYSDSDRDQQYAAEDAFSDLLRDHVGLTVFQHELLRQALDMAGLELKLRQG